MKKYKCQLTIKQKRIIHRTEDRRTKAPTTDQHHKPQIARNPFLIGSTFPLMGTPVCFNPDAATFTTRSPLC
jgi:hypothetical protein